MTEKQFTVEDIEDMIYKLGVLIADESQGPPHYHFEEKFF